ncbi:MAG TPA: YrdB family protein [Thermomicrobiales bacterium]|nr:YrdB family protein [Thermomicrobiales bacterium]
MEIVKAGNLGARFLLELCALVALGYWGFKAGDGPLAKVALGLGAPLLAAVVWGLFVAPNASVAVPHAAHLGLQVLIFGLAAAGLAAAGRPALAGAFGGAVVFNGLLMYAWGQ